MASCVRRLHRLTRAKSPCFTPAANGVGIGDPEALLFLNGLSLFLPEKCMGVFDVPNSKVLA